jgi:peptidoglycan hydrolase-like protein with peptidoglycan-binding domain
MQGPDLPRPLYPPDAAPAYTPSKDGKDVIAWKRAVWRGGRWQGPASGFDDAYSNAFAHGKSGNVGETGIAGFQRQMRIQPTGYIGKATANAIRSALVPDVFPHAGEPLLDAAAVNLLEEYVQEQSQPPPDAADRVRDAIARFCRDSIGAEPAWHYVQQRPMEYLGTPPSSTHHSDCSEHATEAYYWARQQTGIAVPDPNGSGYNGYGYTGTLIDNPKAGSPYKVGDLAIYGASTSSTEHVCTCYVGGDAASSVWCSHGSEAAPYSVALYYRGDLLVVVRPALVP